MRQSWEEGIQSNAFHERSSKNIFSGYSVDDIVAETGGCCPYKGKEQPSTIQLVPYYSRDNRGEKSMAMWLPHKVEVKPQGLLTSAAAGDAKAPTSLAGIRTKIIFEYKSGRRVDMGWIGYNGSPKPYGELAPGACFQRNSYSNTTWLITDENDKPLGHFISGSYQAHAVIPKLD